MPQDDSVGEIRVPRRAGDRKDRAVPSLDGAQASLFVRPYDHALNQQVIGVEDGLEPDGIEPSRKAEHVEHGEHESADLRLAQWLAIILGVHVGSSLRNAA